MVKYIHKINTSEINLLHISRSKPGSLSSAPGPLYMDDAAMCWTYNINTKELILVATCNETMFYYDGEYIRETATHHCITPSQAIDNYPVNIVTTWYNALTHLPLVPHICVNESGQYWFRWWLVAYSAPSHYLNQCWGIVNWTIRNKLEWNFS